MDISLIYIPLGHSLEYLYNFLSGDHKEKIDTHSHRNVILPSIQLFASYDDAFPFNHDAIQFLYLGKRDERDDIREVLIKSPEIDIDEVSTLLSEVLIKPRVYVQYLQELLQVVKFRFSIFHPILISHGFPGLIFPQIDILSNIIFIPECHIFPFQFQSERKELPKYCEVSQKVEAYIQTVYSKMDVIFEEIIRRGAVQKTNRNELVSRTLDVERDENIASKKWSTIMTKKQACHIIGWSAGALNTHIATNPEIARMQRNRQNWRFDCNDPSFASLPIDENYNRNH